MCLSVCQPQLCIFYLLIHPCTPPPHSNVQGGCMHVPISLGKGGIVCCLSREDFPEKKPEKGVFLNQSLRIWGVFQNLPEKLRKRGVLFICTCFLSLQEPPEKWGYIGPLLCCIMYISLVGPPGVMVKYIHVSQARRKEKKMKGDRGSWDRGLPRKSSQDRGSTGKSSLGRGRVLCGKAPERVHQFSRDGGWPINGEEA